MIEVKGIEKDFKVYQHRKGLWGAARSLLSREHTLVKAVDNLNFLVKQGECVGYLGPNGAGKSTTIKMLSGILVPTRGEVRVNGVVPYENRQENAKQIGAVFGQRTQLWWDLPAIESFELLGKLYRVDDKRLKENIGYFTEILELKDFLTTPVRKLSLGQKMRAELTAALLHDPSILYLDEPTIGLDVVAKDRIREFLSRINREKKVTIILTTHDLDDVESLCDRVMIIDHGKLIHDDSLQALKSKYGNYRVLDVDFKEDVNLRIPAGCLERSKEGKKRTIEFDTDLIKAPELISKLSQEYPILDLSVSERPIEEVIKKIYQS